MKAKLAGVNVDTFDPELQPPVIIVKLREGLQVRARGGTWVSDGVDDITGLLSLLSGLGVERIVERIRQSESALLLLHADIESSSGMDEADPLLLFDLHLAAQSVPEVVLEALRQSTMFELVSFEASLHVPAGDITPPVTPDIADTQCYLDELHEPRTCALQNPPGGDFPNMTFDSRGGINLDGVLGRPGARGAGVHTDKAIYRALERTSHGDVILIEDAVLLDRVGQLNDAGADYDRSQCLSSFLTRWSPSTTWPFAPQHSAGVSSSS